MHANPTAPHALCAFARAFFPRLHVFAVHLAAVLLFVAGCTSFSESQGDQMLAPVVAEIAAYRQATGRLPDRLDELPGFARLQLEGKSDAGLVWSITLLRPSANSYWLEFNHAHGIVRYVDGKKVFAKGNPWR